MGLSAGWHPRPFPTGGPASGGPGAGRLRWPLSSRAAVCEGCFFRAGGLCEGPGAAGTQTRILAQFWGQKPEIQAGRAMFHPEGPGKGSSLLSRTPQPGARGPSLGLWLSQREDLCLFLLLLQEHVSLDSGPQGVQTPAGGLWSPDPCQQGHPPRLWGVDMPFGGSPLTPPRLPSASGVYLASGSRRRWPGGVLGDGRRPPRPEVASLLPGRPRLVVQSERRGQRVQRVRVAVCSVPARPVPVPCCGRVVGELLGEAQLRRRAMAVGSVPIRVWAVVGGGSGDSLPRTGGPWPRLPLAVWFSGTACAAAPNRVSPGGSLRPHMLCCLDPHADALRAHSWALVFSIPWKTC